MEIVVIGPENDDEKRNMERRIACFKAYLIYSTINELEISNVDKKELLINILGILESSDDVL